MDFKYIYTLDKNIFYSKIIKLKIIKSITGVSSSGKTIGFGPIIRGFESSHPNISA